MKQRVIWSEYGVLPEAARVIRTTVFVEEQGFQEEFDIADKQSYHALLLLSEEPVGTARLFREDEQTMHIGRVALQKRARSGGYGRILLNAACDKAKQFGARTVILGAQQRAAGFYGACGFIAYGEPYDEEGCPHIMMKKDV